MSTNTPSDVQHPKPDQPYAWSRTLEFPIGVVFVGRNDPQTVPTGAQVTRHFADVAVRGRYVGICWR